MRVGLFVTCLVDAIRPNIGLSTVKLLEEAGCEVVYPKSQTCCGQPAYNSGDRKSSQALAKKLMTEFSDVDYIVIPSGSCAGMIKVHYEELFDESPDLKAKAQWLAARTYELTDFLETVLGVESFATPFRGSITYHDSCAGLRELGVKKQPRSLLQKIPDLEIVELPGAEECCGFGGTFSVKYGDISGRIVDLKCDDVESTEADALVLGDLGCMMNIEGRLRRRGNKTTKVLHVSEVLAGMISDDSE